MERPIILMHLPGSPLAARIAAHLGAGRPVHLCDLDAPLSGAPVTVRAGAVLWQGADLLGAAAVWVEAPLFPWPQSPPAPDRLPPGLTEKDWSVRQREARSLAAAALFCAAETRPQVNRPESAHLAASPAVALDRLAAAGLPVHPWRLAAAPAPEALPAATAPPLVLDAAGRDRWHAPASPRPGDPALILPPFAGRAETLLVVGGRVAARRTCAGAAAWRRAEGAVAPAGETVPAAAALAVGAAAALDLDVAAVSLRDGALFFCEAAPDLAAWDAATGGRVAAALAGHLLTVAAAPAAIAPARGAAS